MTYFLPTIDSGKHVYAGFWKRFCALFADGFILIPIAFGLIWLGNFDKALAIATAIVHPVAFTLYHVFFNVKYGGTLGKLAAGIRVTKPNGTKIGWSEAWKRSSVNILFNLILTPARVWALSQVNWTEYSALEFFEKFELLQTFYPSWEWIVDWGVDIWIWSELIVLMFNERKRALHDFIAGTVVIHKEFATDYVNEENQQVFF